MDVLNDSSVFLMPDVVPNKLKIKTSSPKKGIPVTNLPIPVRPSRGSSSDTKKSPLRYEDVVRHAMDTIENFQLNLQKTKSGARHQDFTLDLTESSTPSPVSSIGTPTLNKKIQKNTQLLDKLKHQMDRKARLQAQTQRDRNGSLDSNFCLPPPIDFTFDRGTPVRSDIEIHRAHSETKDFNTRPSTSQFHNRNSIPPLVYDSEQHDIFPFKPKTLTFADTDFGGSKRLTNLKTSHDRSAQVDIQQKHFDANTSQVETNANYKKSVDQSVQVHQTSEEHLKKNAKKLDNNGSNSSPMVLNVEPSNDNNKMVLIKSTSNSKLTKIIPQKRTSSCPNIRTLPAALGLNKPKVQEQRVVLPPMDVDSIPKKKNGPISTKRTLGSSGFRVKPAPKPRQKALDVATKNKDDAISSKGKTPKRNLPFIATCSYSQFSYSLTANRQQILALLKRYLPNNAALRNMVLNIESGVKTNVIKKFITVSEEEMAHLNTKYVKTLNEYEQTTNVNEIHEMDREMDKFQREYDTMKILVDKLKSMTGPTRPLSSHNDEGGIVHQMQMIQNAISYTFAL